MPLHRTIAATAAAITVALVAAACTSSTAGRPVGTAGTGPATTGPATTGAPTTGAPTTGTASVPGTTIPGTTQPGTTGPGTTRPGTTTSPGTGSPGAGSGVDLISTILHGTGTVGGKTQPLASFRSVSGNIACTLLGAADGRVACTIYHRQSWPDTSCAAGPTTVRLDVAGTRASSACTADQPQSAATRYPVLAYNHSVYAGNYACLDASAGLSCVDLNTGAGFRLAQAAFVVVPAPNQPNTCSTSDLRGVAVPGGVHGGTYTVSDVRTTSTGPLWAAFTASSPTMEDGALVIAYCSPSGWDGVSAVSNGLSCPPPVTARQLAQLRVTGCVPAHATPSGVQPATPAYPDSLAPATRLATSSCRTWAYAGQLDAADGSRFFDVAASQARDASTLSAQWTPLATWTTFISSLPETSNTPANVNRAARIEPRLRQTCGQLGVTILG